MNPLKRVRKNNSLKVTTFYECQLFASLYTICNLYIYMKRVPLLRTPQIFEDFIDFFISYFQFIYLSEKTQNKFHVQFWKIGHSENVHF